MRTGLRADIKANYTKRIAFDGIMCAVALVLSYIETLVPLELLIHVPGVKIGLANISVMLVFFTVSKADAAAVSFTRVLLASLLFGSPVSFIYSLTGAAAAYIGMIVLSVFFKKQKISFIGVSVFCAALHNIGQTAAACVMFTSFSPSYYLPALLLAGTFMGLASGMLANLLYPTAVRLLNKKN